MPQPSRPSAAATWRPRRPPARLGALGALGAAAALSACGNDPILPAFSGPTPVAQLQVWALDAGDTIPTTSFAPPDTTPVRLAPAPGLLVVYGQFFPGEVGRFTRRGVDQLLRVNGVAIEPRASFARSVEYRAELPLPRDAAGGPDAVTIALPRVEGASALEPTLRLPLVRRAGARVAGGTLRLAVTVPPDVAAAARWGPARWQVDVARGAARGSVTGDGRLRDTLLVPVAQLLPGGAEPLTARLTEQAQYQWGLLWAGGEPRSADTTYRVTATVTASLRWAAVAPERTP